MSSNTNRVVVTGIGLVTCLSSNTEKSWQEIIVGRSGIRKIGGFPVEDLPVTIGGEVLDINCGGDFNAEDYIRDPKDIKKLDKFILYGIAAAKQAIADSGILEISNLDKNEVGVAVGSGIGGLPLIEKNSLLLEQHGAKRISPFFIPASLVNLISGNISIEYGFTGPNDANVTACATGAHAIANSYRMIRNNEAKIIITGAAEGALCRIGIAGFAAMKALSRNNNNPSQASRPWDKARDGFVMGDGAGILVLEDYEHAKKRGAKIYGEILGYGATGDAYHVAAPHPEGLGGLRAMQLALKMANKTCADINYINAHGTSTPAGDLIELRAIKRLFANDLKEVAMSSTKSVIGHTLGAAGSIEAIFALLAMRDSILPPTINLENPEPECEGINLIPNKAQEKKINTVLSNSFGFGGTNVALIMGRI